MKRKIKTAKNNELIEEYLLAMDLGNLKGPTEISFSSVKRITSMKYFIYVNDL